MFRRKPGVRPRSEEEADIQRPPGVLERLLVPTSLLDLTLRGLRGYAPGEGLAYWFGREISQGLGLTMVVAFPRILNTQASFELAPGEMAKLANWAAREELWILSQVHTHPADEPHSVTDEGWAPTFRKGFLSLVIPFSAQFSSLHRPGWRDFEADGAGGWVRIDADRVRVFNDVWLSEG